MLSPEQQRVVETWGKGMAVIAGAGSGKTTTLVAKCVRLLELNPHARFAAVSFTERSARDLREKLASNLGTLQFHWVTTIHGLCGALLREYPQAAGFDGEETVLSEMKAQALWEKAFEQLWSATLSESLQRSFQELLDRERLSGLMTLLQRARELWALGLGEQLQRSEDPSERALGLLTPWVMQRYSRMKRRQAVVDFHDLEQAAARILQNETIAEVYHRRFDLVLVDEFQDTNPLQGQTLWKFARPEGSNLCVVGDPKQSIYRFRDADVSVFEEYCQKLPVQQSLTWNFRSVPEIIEFANQMCAPLFAASGMPFEALVPKRASQIDQEPVFCLKIQKPEDLADWLLQDCAQGGRPLHERVLLLRKIRGQEHWIRALSGRGLSLAMGSGGFFWEEPRVQELIAFLRWWDCPSNTLCGAIFLRAPWMGISDACLDQWIQQDATFYRPFFESQHPLALRLRSFCHQPVSPSTLLLILLEQPELERELGAVILALWHRAEQAHQEGQDFKQIIKTMTLALQKNLRERDVPAPQTLGQLPVSTIHGSKGLEFPEVILIDFPEKTRSSEMPLLFWDRHQGAYLGRRHWQGDRCSEDPQEVIWRELERKKNVAESQRLFYVALTRARQRLILVCPELKSDVEPKSTGEPVSQRDDWRGWLDASSVSIPCRTPDPISVQRSLDVVTTVKQDQQSLWERPASQKKTSWRRVRHSVTEWVVLSQCLRSYEWRWIRPRYQKTADHLNRSIKSGPSEMELGIQLHAALQRVDHPDFEESLNKIQDDFGENRFQAQFFLDWVKTTDVMQPSDVYGGRKVYTELAFEVPFEDQVLVGAIDRLVVHADDSEKNQVHIIDFKVMSRLKPQEVLLQMYAVQIELYAYAVQVLLKNKNLNISGELVIITPRQIQRIQVPLGQVHLSELCQKSLRIIQGQPGAPQPGWVCFYCPFNHQCAESQDLMDILSP